MEWRWRGTSQNNEICQNIPISHRYERGGGWEERGRMGGGGEDGRRGGAEKVAQE